MLKPLFQLKKNFRTLKTQRRILSNKDCKAMINKLALKISIRTAGDSLGIPRSSYYYWEKSEAKSTKKGNRKLPNFAYF